MRPIIRPLLADLGLGREYFQASNNPVVRARATLAYVNQFHKQAIPLNWLAGKLVRDCITPDLKIHLGVAEIYKDFIHKSLNESQFDLLRNHLFDRVAGAQAKPLLAMTIFSLVPTLGLNVKFPTL